MNEQEEFDELDEEHEYTVTISVRHLDPNPDPKVALRVFIDMAAMEGFNNCLLDAQIEDCKTGRKFRADAETLNKLNTLIDTGLDRAEKFMSALDKD